MQVFGVFLGIVVAIIITLLVTSGNAKIFPRDILVGKVIEVKEDHYIALPYVDFKNLNYVQVVKSK